MRATYAIDVLGSAAQVARDAQTTRQNVWNWKDRGDEVPEKYARRLDGKRGTRNRVLRFDPKAYGLDS